MEELCRICHISKRKGKWLLENGYIPYKDTRKKTHRYQIEMTDVVEFLTMRDSGFSEYRLPVGAFSSRGDGSVNPIAVIEPNDFKKFLSAVWSHVSDALTIRDIGTLTGYSIETVNNWIWLGRLKVVRTQSGKIVAKEWLLEFIACYVKDNPNRLSRELRKLAKTYVEQFPNQ